MTEREELATMITEHVFNEIKYRGRWVPDDIKRAVLEVLPKQFNVNSEFNCNPLPALFKKLADELGPLDDPNYVPSILREAIKTIKLQKDIDVLQNFKKRTGESMNRSFKTRGKLYLFWRAIRFWWQRRTRGWDDSVTWNLDQQIAVWLAPRLHRFRELNNGFPSDSSPDDWDAELDEMVWAAEWYAKNVYETRDKQEWTRAMYGIRQVTVRLKELWW